MVSERHLSFIATDRSYLAILKKDLRHVVTEAGFPPKRIAEIDIIVAEMTSNLMKHGNGGEILMKIFEDEHNQCVELICIDNGPGMQDVPRMLEDGISTTNTLGQGLGAIKRLSHVFDIYSLPGWGTIILSRVYKEEPTYEPAPATEVRSVIVAKPGESESGDAAYAKHSKDYLKIFIGDGLGHGPEAAKATEEAIRAFRISALNSPAETIRFIHKSVKKTRGLVGTIAQYSFSKKKWLICGVGNIASRLYTAAFVKNCMSYNGIIGMNIPNTMKDQNFIPEYGQVLVMCSDGIKTRWENQKYPAIFRHDLTIFAAALYKDFARKTDDMSIVVSRINKLT